MGHGRIQDCIGTSVVQWLGHWPLVQSYPGFKSPHARAHLEIYLGLCVRRDRFVCIESSLGPWAHQLWFNFRSNRWI